MARIPDAFIDELLTRLDVVEVVGRYLPLKKSGQNYTACCPFHQEKTASFSVNPHKQFYHCFGCGAHGNALRFVMEFKGLGFIEAVEELASGVGLSVPRQALAQPDHAPIRQCLQQAAQYYCAQLRQTPAAINYLKQRGVNGTTAAKFALGFAPADWQNLAMVFADYAQNPDLATAGLVLDGKRRYDRFRERIMFPIRTPKGDVIGFGGRALGQGEPKYLNSPETPLFIKGHTLYGLFEGREAIRQAGKVLLVEGYMDVVALNQYGIGYSVAALGTAATAHHVRQLQKLTQHLIFCFDGDQAGQRAAWRALENTLPQLEDGTLVEFLHLPNGEDPDSFIRRYGLAAWEQQLAQAEPLSDYWLRQLSEPQDSPEGKARLFQHAKPLLAQVQAPALRLLLQQALAQRMGITLTDLHTVLGNPVAASVEISHAPSPALAHPTHISTRIHSAQPDFINQLLTMVLHTPALAQSWNFPEFQAQTAHERALLAVLKQAEQTQDAEQLLQQFPDTQAGYLRTQQTQLPSHWAYLSFAEQQAEFNGLQHRLRQQYLHQKLQSFHQRQTPLTPDEQSQYHALQQQLRAYHRPPPNETEST